MPCSVCISWCIWCLCIRLAPCLKVARQPGLREVEQPETIQPSAKLTPVIPGQKNDGVLAPVTSGDGEC